MVYRSVGTIFAGFDLEKYRHLQDLANGLEYWLAGGRDENSKPMKRLTQRQANSIKDIPYRMERSPLLTEIITPLLHAPRNGGRNAPQELLAAGKDIEDYAIVGAYNPGTGHYQDALLAWKNRWPVQRVGYLHPRHKEMAEEAVQFSKAQAERRKREAEYEKLYPGGIEPDVSLLSLR